MDTTTPPVIYICFTINCPYLHLYPLKKQINIHLNHIQHHKIRMQATNGVKNQENAVKLWDNCKYRILSGQKIT